MLFYGALIYISYVYSNIKGSKKLFDIILAKLLYCISVCGMISEIFMKRIETANMAILLANHKLMIEKFSKPLILYNSARLLVGLYVLIVFFGVLFTFLRTKENKNMVFLVTFLCFLISFLVFFCCPYFVVCYSFIFLPGILGLFAVTLSMRELTPKHKRENNIKSRKFKFVMCIISLVLIIINIVFNALWIIFGGEILKFYFNLNQSNFNM